MTFQIDSFECPWRAPAEMGPRFFPTVLGALLILPGPRTVVQSRARGTPVAGIAAVCGRAPAFNILAISGFAHSLPHFGLVLSETLLVALEVGKWSSF